MVLIGLFMSVSCIHAEDIDDIADTNQTADIDTPALDDGENQDCQLDRTFNDVPMIYALGVSHRTSDESMSYSAISETEQTGPSNETGCDVNGNQNDTTEGFNPDLNLNHNLTKEAIGLESGHRHGNFTKEAIGLDCSYKNGTLENAISDTHVTGIDCNFSGDFNYSYDLIAGNQVLNILNYTQINSNIVTVPRNLDEEEDLRYLNLNYNQALEEPIHRYYNTSTNSDGSSNGGSIIDPELFDDLESYNPSLTIDKYLSFNYTNTAVDLSSSNFDNTALEINDSFSDKLIVDDNLEYSICTNPHLIIEANVVVGLFNNNVINHHTNKITITDTIIFNNSFSSDIFVKNFETIFNQELLTEDYITDDDYEDLIEEFTLLTINVGLSDQESDTFIKNTVFNKKCTTDKVETVEFIEDSIVSLFAVSNKINLLPFLGGE